MQETTVNHEIGKRLVTMIPQNRPQETTGNCQIGKQLMKKLMFFPCDLSIESRSSNIEYNANTLTESWSVGMVFNINEPVEIYTQDGNKLDIVEDFKYLGSLTKGTENDVKVRKASAWKACNKVRKIWKSSLSRAFKQSLNPFCQICHSP